MTWYVVFSDHLFTKSADLVNCPGSQPCLFTGRRITSPWWTSSLPHMCCSLFLPLLLLLLLLLLPCLQDILTSVRDFWISFYLGFQGLWAEFYIQLTTISWLERRKEAGVKEEEDAASSSSSWSVTSLLEGAVERLSFPLGRGEEGEEGLVEGAVSRWAGVEKGVGAWLGAGVRVVPGAGAGAGAAQGRGESEAC